MKKLSLIVLSFMLLLLAACSTNGDAKEETQTKSKNRFKVGLMLSDVGLGDQSFSDLAFQGLIKARNEENILFNYKELADTKTYEQGLTELVEEGNDLIIGLGFMVQEDLEKVAKKYPDQQFLLIDSTSDVKNITSITFKEDEGSFLAGVLAASITKTNTIGFLGGEKAPVIEKFEKGFTEGAKAINPAIRVLSQYAGDFGNNKLGGTIAKQMIDQKADVLYAAAGFTGVGLLQEAQKNKVMAIGVDSDQYFYAEKAVVSSMMKNIDVAIIQYIQEINKKGNMQRGHMELGIKEGGVGLAPIRIIEDKSKIEGRLESWEKKLSSNN